MTTCLYCGEKYDEPAHEVVCAIVHEELIKTVYWRKMEHLYASTSKCPTCLKQTYTMVYPRGCDRELACFDLHCRLVQLAFTGIRKDRQIDELLASSPNKIPDSVFQDALKMWVYENKISLGLLVGAGGLLIVGALILAGAYIVGIGAAAGLSGAAATSAGLAGVGGGSLATGGAGMAGGVTIIGSGAATTAVGGTATIAVIAKLLGSGTFKSYAKRVIYSHGDDPYVDVLRNTPIVGTITYQGVFIGLERLAEPL